MPSVTGECKARRIKRLLVVTCLTVLVLLCTACGLLGTNEIATVDPLFNSKFTISPDIFPLGTNTYSISVRLKPTDVAQPNTIYEVDLYEQGQLRATTTISWNQLELNVLTTKYVHFPASEEEYDTYLGNNIDHLFSIKIHE